MQLLMKRGDFSVRPEHTGTITAALLRLLAGPNTNVRMLVGSLFFELCTNNRLCICVD